MKKLVFNHYGRECKCCGENNSMFLTIDHINNDGYKYRKKNKGHINYRWIVNNKFPKDLQVLCMNCNFGKRLNDGICPHKSLK